MRKLDYSGTEVVLEAEELRGIIRGDIGVRKCPDCDGKGESWFLHYVFADDVSESEETKPVGDEFATNFELIDHPQYSFGECVLYDCDTCSKVGYIINEY